MQADRIIGELAAGQHGLVTRRQLAGAGVPGHLVDYRLRAGLLVSLHPGVYRAATIRPTWEQRSWAPAWPPARAPSPRTGPPGSCIGWQVSSPEPR